MAIGLVSTVALLVVIGSGITILLVQLRSSSDLQTREHQSLIDCLNGKQPYCPAVRPGVPAVVTVPSPVYIPTPVPGPTSIKVVPTLVPGPTSVKVVPTTVTVTVTATPAPLNCPVTIGNVHVCTSM